MKRKASAFMALSDSESSTGSSIDRNKVAAPSSGLKSSEGSNTAQLLSKQQPKPDQVLNPVAVNDENHKPPPPAARPVQVPTGHAPPPAPVSGMNSGAGNRIGVSLSRRIGHILRYCPYPRWNGSQPPPTRDELESSGSTMELLSQMDRETVDPVVPRDPPEEDDADGSKFAEWGALIRLGNGGEGIDLDLKL